MVFKISLITSPRAPISFKEMLTGSRNRNKGYLTSLAISLVSIVRDGDHREGCALPLAGKPWVD